MFRSQDRNLEWVHRNLASFLLWLYFNESHHTKLNLSQPGEFIFDIFRDRMTWTAQYWGSIWEHGMDRRSAIFAESIVNNKEQRRYLFQIQWVSHWTKRMTTEEMFAWNEKWTEIKAHVSTDNYAKMAYQERSEFYAVLPWSFAALTFVSAKLWRNIQKLIQMASASTYL